MVDLHEALIEEIETLISVEGKDAFFGEYDIISIEVSKDGTILKKLMNGDVNRQVQDKKRGD
ncbi:MAG: hypothetical protein NTU61_05075 [Candidatus Altiarchaeota archaeon]|nr:hypothetical protein [Candidatus Altiarchaeota archaeon]